jgi:hypothetical protein
LCVFKKLILCVVFPTAAIISSAPNNYRLQVVFERNETRSSFLPIPLSVQQSLEQQSVHLRCEVAFTATVMAAFRDFYASSLFHALKF